VIIELNRKNRDFEITKPVYTGGTNIEVYTIREVSSDKQFGFAIRNCWRAN
jgi:hypothetical protein